MARLAPAALAALLLAAVPAPAEEPWLDAPLSADPAAVLKAAAAPLAQEKPGDGNGLRSLLEEERWSFDAEGRRTVVSRRVVVVLRSDALDDAGTVEAAWKPWKDEPPLLRARVVQRDGTVHLLDERTVADRPASSDPDVFDDRRVRSAPLPGLEEGAVVEWETVAREKTPVPGGTVGGAYLATFVPVKRIRVVVESPEKLPVAWKTRGVDLAPTVKRAGGVVTRTWEVAEPAVLPEPEAGVPADVVQQPFLEFATGGSWAEVARRYSRIVEEKLATEPAPAPPAGKAGRPPLEQVDELLATVQREVRYTGLAFGDSSIVPSAPRDVRQRKFGDCKDQATLLVGLLRERGLDAAVALLRAGPGWDVADELPALGAFDHAVVHVAGVGKEGLFVDPTSVFHRAGQLPEGDQGRRALLCRPGTTRLVTIPASSAKENAQSTRIEIRLADFGPGSFRETIEYSSVLEAYSRRLYDGLDEARRRRDFEQYAEQGYGRATLKRFTVTPPRSLGEPFRLTVEGEKANVAMTADTEAVFGVRRSALLSNLPEAPAAPRRLDRAVIPLRHEIDYTVVPPRGFVPRDLPEASTVPLGPATLTTAASAGPDGSVRLVLSVVLDRRRMTGAELDALGKAVEEIRNESPLLVAFDHVAEAALSRGDVRGAIDELKRQERLDPARADPRRRMSKVLLAIGLGEAARREAREAVRLEPQSARAWHQLGLVLQHDRFGRLRRQGWEPAEAEAALSKGVELDPENLDIRLDRTFLLEHDAGGVRYRDQARLGRAVSEYAALLTKRPQSTDLARGHALALLHAGRPADALAFLQGRPDAEELRPLRVAATAAKEGAEKGLALLRREASDAARRRADAEAAGAVLFTLRRYDAAALLFGEAARGGTRAAELGARADFCSRLRRAERPAPQPLDPAAVVRTFLWDVLDEEREADVERSFVRAVRSVPGDEGRPRVVEEAASLRRNLLADARASGLPPETTRDVLLSSPELVVDGNAKVGWSVKGSFGSGSDSTVFWLAEEEKAIRIVATDEAPDGLLRLALERAAKGDAEGARRWLDRAREAETGTVRDDHPLWGPLLPRFWPVEGAGVAESRRAAIASLADSRLGAAELSELRAAWKERPGDRALTVALARALAALARPPRGKPHEPRPELWKELLETLDGVRRAEPDVEDWTALSIEALSRLSRYDEARRLGEEHLQRKPSHVTVKGFLAQAVLRQGDFEKALALSEEIVAAPQATALDYNNAAWFRMVAGRADERTLGLALKAVEGTRRRNLPALNTLAAVYAELARADEARALVLEGMEISQADDPTAPDWYVVGRLLEGFGLVEDALAAYAEAVDPSEDPLAADGITSLARRRAAALKARAGT